MLKLNLYFFLITLISYSVISEENTIDYRKLVLQSYAKLFEINDIEKGTYVELRIISNSKLNNGTPEKLKIYTSKDKVVYINDKFESYSDNKINISIFHEKKEIIIVDNETFNPFSKIITLPLLDSCLQESQILECSKIEATGTFEADLYIKFVTDSNSIFSKGLTSIAYKINSTTNTIEEMKMDFTQVHPYKDVLIIYDIIEFNTKKFTEEIESIVFNKDSIINDRFKDYKIVDSRLKK